MAAQGLCTHAVGHMGCQWRSGAATRAKQPRLHETSAAAGFLRWRRPRACGVRRAGELWVGVVCVGSEWNGAHGPVLHHIVVVA